MLFAAAVVLFVAWLLGITGVYTIGAIVHLLLVMALACLGMGWLKSVI